MKTTLLILTILFTAQCPTDIFSVSDSVQPELNSVENITGTMYNAMVSQCDSDPLVTAGMYRIVPERASEHGWIAMSRNLLSRWGGEFNYGDKVVISNAGHKDGIYTVVDTMNPRFENRIDFLETVGTSHYVYDNITITKI